MSNVSPFRRRGAGQPELPVGRGGAMLVIAVMSPGPGAGRTMLAAHIAVQAEVTGDGPVGLVDTDPKGDLFRWWTRRQGKMETPAAGAHCDASGLGVALDGVAATGARICIVDTAAADDEALAAIAGKADMVLIPTDADPRDTTEAAALGGRFPRRTKIAYVVNCRTHGGVEEGNALSAISSGSGWPAGTVQHAKAFAIAMTAGRAVTESHAGSEAARDIAEIWENLRGILVAG